ncbi:hypothetical protein SNE40_009127 [Patella caerulea]|uniref:Uncharacterized protein n=1 Tax=Patella caerulea TaxID=87958 RepID=A0AAN8JRV6_PATCE
MGNSLGMRRRVELPDGTDDAIEDLDVGGEAENLDAENDDIETVELEESLPGVNIVVNVKNSPDREKLRRHVLMKDIFPKIRKARVNSNATQFWISPFERQPYSEPTIKANGEYSSDEPGTLHFPRFLDNLINNTFRLHIRLKQTNAKPEILEKHPEVEYLMRNLKFIKVKLMHHPLDSKIKISIEESHGRRRNTSVPRFRPMYGRFLFLDHLQPSLFISGGEFMLNLTPPQEGMPGARADGNGELPEVVGYYSRQLDSNPNIVMEWSVAVWNWYNNTDHYHLHYIEEL